MKKPDAILTADWHIRGDSPVCRTDDYMEAQEKKIRFILELSSKYSCPILIAGDFGHRPYWGDVLLNWAIDIFNDASEEGDYLHDNTGIILYIIPGQHDLPNHRLDRWWGSGLGIFYKSFKKCNVMLLSEYLNNTSIQMYGFSYGEKIKKEMKSFEAKKIAIAHQMVIKSQKDKLWPDQQANSAKKLLKDFPCYDLIVTGDNHQSFVVEHEGRLLVNPGSTMRMTADQIDFEPRVYLWYAKTNAVKPVYLPIEKGVISREHIEEKEKRDKRIEAFVNRLSDSYEIGLSFEKNIEKFFNKNKIEDSIKEKVWGAIEC